MRLLPDFAAATPALRAGLLPALLALAALAAGSGSSSPHSSDWFAPAERARIDRIDTAQATTPSPRQWHLERLHAPQAWRQAAGEGVVIAILDSGVDAQHPDLAGQLLPGRNFMDGGTDTRDATGHGTAVAAAAAAAFNRQERLAGMATRARILPLKVSDERGYASARAVHDAIIHAADSGVRVVNVSFEDVITNPLVMRAAAYLRAKGGVLVVPTGNGGQLTRPQAAAGMITVAATDLQDQHPEWSSGGAGLAVAAPGVDLLLARRGGGYARCSGTSYASPLVAGVLALMLAAKPEAGIAELVRVMQATAVDLGEPGPDALFGHGRVDAAAAVAALTRGSGAASPDRL